MDTELLKTFLEVSRTRHFGRAAESLYLTQSAVSFRIRQLENQLGASLFTRHRNNIRLTSAGERLLPYAESLINTWLLAKQEVEGTLQHTELSIGAIASLWEAYLTPWLQSLYQQQPSLQLEARVAPRYLLVKQLHERELDLLITTEPPKMDELNSQLLGHLSLRLFSSAHQQASTGFSYINLEWGADFAREKAGLAHATTRSLLTTTSAHLTREFMASTNSHAFLPEHWQQHYPEMVMDSATPAIVRPLYGIWLQNSAQHILINQLLTVPLNTYISLDPPVV